MKFIDIVCDAFFARQSPVSTSAKPACMNMTKKPVINVQTMLIEITFLPTRSATSLSVSPLAASATGILATPPAFAPVESELRGGGVAGAASAAAGVAVVRLAPSTSCSWPGRR